MRSCLLETQDSATGKLHPNTIRPRNSYDDGEEVYDEDDEYDSDEYYDPDDDEDDTEDQDAGPTMS